MSNTTLTNIPSKLDIRVKEPSGIGAQVPPAGPGSPDRFKRIFLKYFFFSTNLDNTSLILKI